jgi:hypothetical protein
MIQINSIENYLEDRPILDWLELYGKERGFIPKKVTQPPSKQVFVSPNENVRIQPVFKNDDWEVKPDIAVKMAHLEYPVMFLDRSPKKKDKAYLMIAFTVANNVTNISEGTVVGFFCLETSVTQVVWEEKIYLEILDAVQWLKELETQGKNWDPTSPKRKEMFPNSKIYSSKWQHVIDHLCEKHIYITDLYHCGSKQRDFLLKKGIHNVEDVYKVNGDIPGVPRTKQNLIKKISWINSPDNSIIIAPRVLKKHKKFLSNLTNYCTFDFETCIYEKKQWVTVIGCYLVKNGEFSFHQWYLKNLTIEEEKEMLVSWNKWLINLVDDITFFHWSNAEKTINSKLQDQYTFLIDIRMFDLLNIFLDEEIVLKGSYDYKLKSVGRALHSLGYITKNWDEKSNVQDGFLAAQEAKNIYSSFHTRLQRNNRLSDLLLYNRVDTEILSEFINFLKLYSQH